MATFTTAGIKFPAKNQGESMKADKDYFLDADRQLTDDEEKSAFLLIRQGQEISKEVADKYGIGKVAQTEEAEITVEEKAVKPSANKSKKPTENKGVK